MKFEVLINDQYIVLKHGTSSLWWTRSPPTPTHAQDNSSFKTKVISSPELKILKECNNPVWDDFTCHGLSYGFVGLFQSDKLIVIKQSQSIGRLPFGHHDEVFKIQKICVISLENKGDTFGDLGLDKCPQDCCTKPVIIMEPCITASFKDSMIEESSLKFFTPAKISSQTLTSTSGVQKTWNQIKMTASNVKPRVSNKIPMISNSSTAQQSRIDEKDKFERRFVDELYKMFNDTSSFYYSWTGDLTNSVQRQQKMKQCEIEHDIRLIPLWKRVDDRFFWNKYMLGSVIEQFEALTPTKEVVLDENQTLKSFSHIWVLPIIQGFVQIERCFFDLNQSSPVGGNTDNVVKGPLSDQSNRLNLDGQTLTSILEGRDFYLMALISRRSRFRAGTRYKKRGLDEDGKCANYVETEQIFTYGFHTVSFVCIRGSVPLFWSQLGHKYRPPPRLERSETENQKAFRRHFEQEFSIYGGSSVAISLIEQTGREKILGEAFTDHVVALDDPRLTYITFDFHDYCRGMKFENVSILVDRIYEFIKEMRYTWVDCDGMICEQRGVFRINCIDCLDRTNIVMTAIAKAVMDIQLVRLGLLPPEGQLPANSRRIFQLMWAHNGDTISRQYAGTAALKGDYTRTGERKISGVVRDGYNSANRYYLNRFKDAYRQAVIDIMQGIPVSDVLSSPEHDKSNKVASMSISNNSLSTTDQEYHERIKLVIEDCKKILVPEEEVILGGWPLVDADPVTGSPLSSIRVYGELPESEMDIVLILTKDCYYVADYDDQTDRIVKYQKVLLEDLEKIELGAEPVSASNNPFVPIRTQGSRIISYAVRFHYTIGEQTGYFHMFRSTSTRFFNNMAIPIRTREEALESLKAICESFKVALSVKSLNVPFLEVSRLERRKSKRLYGASFKLDSSSESSSQSSNRFRSNDNGQPSVGNSRKLFTGVYSHFSRLRGKLTGFSNTSGVGSNRPNLLDGIKSNANFSGPITFSDVENLNEDEDDSDEDDSLLKLRKKRFNPQGTTNSSSSSLVVERTLSSDLSECSDFEDSEQMLPPICEIGSPGGDEPLSHKENMDRVLESCGILVTSPPLRQTSQSDRDTGSTTPFKAQELSKYYSDVTPDNKVKSVLHDVDDFVLDSMKKASLRQIHRKAVSQSQVSLFSSSNSIHDNVTQENPRINVDSNNLTPDIPSRSSSRCIFSSELALNSIVSQSIKKDIVNKLSGSISTDALDVTAGSVGASSSLDLNFAPDQAAYQCGAYPLMSSSSFAALSYLDQDFTSYGPELLSYRPMPEDYIESDANALLVRREHSTMLDMKESSLSVSDLAFTGTGGYSLKTSRSSNTLQASGSMSLNLPSANSASVISISEDSDLTPNATSSNFTSSLMVKKDLVLSPLTRIAKGMQSLGLNLRNTSLSDQQSCDENFSELQQRKRETRSRIIEL